MAKIQCAKCEALNDTDAKACWKCKTPISFEQYQAALAEEDEQRRLAAQTDNQRSEAEAARVRAAEEAFASGNFRAIPDDLRGRFARRVIVSTSPFIYGREVESVVDIVTAECAFGLNIIKDLFNSARDFFGGRSQTTQKAFRDARVICLDELRKEALAVGANAVVSVDLDYSDMAGGAGAGGMLFLVASGTAVRLAPLKSTAPQLT